MEYIFQIILTIIAGITTIFTIILQKKQDNLTNKIDESGALLKYKRNIKEEINKNDLEHRVVLDKLSLLMLDIYILLLTNDRYVKPEESANIRNQIINIQKELEELEEKRSELNHKYLILQDIPNETFSKSS